MCKIYVQYSSCTDKKSSYTWISNAQVKFIMWKSGRLINKQTHLKYNIISIIFPSLISYQKQTAMPMSCCQATFKCTTLHKKLNSVRILLDYKQTCYNMTVSFQAHPSSVICFAISVSFSPGLDLEPPNTDKYSIPPCRPCFH